MKKFLIPMAAGILLAALNHSFAGDIPAPTPLATALPDRATECIGVDEMVKDLQQAITDQGGSGERIDGAKAQAFDDAWRQQTHAPAAKVATVLAWINTTIVLAEIDDKGCLISLTPIDPAAFAVINGNIKASVKAPELLPYNGLSI